MPVTTTPQDIITAARLRSIKPTSATDATELKEVVVRALRGIYSVAARVNPFFFGDTETVVFGSGGWARPANSESIVRVELETEGGAEVAVTELDDKLAEAGMPSVYRFAQKYRTVGRANDPEAADDLVFWFAKIPDTPANIAAPLDQTWVEHFNELLILETAIYLALKDRRFDEVGELKPARNDWARLFIQFLEHETVTISRRFGQFNRYTVADLLPMLAGGA